MRGKLDDFVVARLVCSSPLFAPGAPSEDDSHHFGRHRVKGSFACWSIDESSACYTKYQVYFSEDLLQSVPGKQACMSEEMA